MNQIYVVSIIYQGTTLIKSTLGYLLLDTAWILMQPKCVPSGPSVLIVHHIATIVFISIPLLEPRYIWHGALVLLVEVNTLCLVARRRLPRRSWLHGLANAVFYSTWVVMRLFVFPLLVYLFYMEYVTYTHEQAAGNWVNIVLLGPVLQTLLTLLGFKWTFDMLMKQLRGSHHNESENNQIKSNGKESSDCQNTNTNSKDNKVNNKLGECQDSAKGVGVGDNSAISSYFTTTVLYVVLTNVLLVVVLSAVVRSVYP